jgi:putative Mg2+ transporter-C (MgtC) family protein
MISEWSIMLRILFAALLGALVGWERERQNQPAGLRTHIILVTGATLAMALSINLSMQFKEVVPNGDPARLAAQVLSGIGFLCAGAILRDGVTVKGLTTATSLWTMAVVGLAVGAGYYYVAGAITLLMILVLTVLNWFERRYIHAVMSMAVTLHAEDRTGMVDLVRQVLSSGSRRITSFAIRRNLEEKDLRLDVTVETREAASLSRITDELSAITGVRTLKVS